MSRNKSHHKSSQALPEAPNGNPLTKKHQRDRLDYFKFIVEIVGLFFLIAYTGYARRQWREMHHSLLVDQRAWLGFEQPKNYNLESDRPFDITVPLRNVGKTPATNISAGFQLAYSSQCQKLDFDAIVNPLMGPPAAVLLPGQPQELTGRMIDQTTGKVPKDVIDNVSVMGAHGCIFAIGKVKHIDVFSVPHWTTSCLISRPAFGGGIEFKQCQDYNGIDGNQE